MSEELPIKLARRRTLVRCFFVLLVCGWILDVLPYDLHPMLQSPKSWLSSALTACGLSQGQWAMFAPNPSINNQWLSADISKADGSRSTWNSPYWEEVGSWEKFYRFRHVNYFNRIWLLQNRRATQDFANYLSRTNLPGPNQVVLSVNGLRLIEPEDGSFPRPEDITWVTFSNMLAEAQSP